MHNQALLAAAVGCAFAIAAPAASAETQALSGTYAAKYAGVNGSPPYCPGEAFVCGSGTAAGLGSFTDATVGLGPGITQTTLTFVDGSTLLLDETLVSDINPGNSGSSNQPGFALGHPGNQVWLWTVAGGTGEFSGASGSGTDAIKEAGARAAGILGGSITTT